MLTSTLSAETEAETTPPRLRLAAPPWRSIAVHLRRSPRTTSAAEGESSATVSELAETERPNDDESDSESSVKVVRRASVRAGAVTWTTELVSEKWPEPLITEAIESVSRVPSTWNSCGEAEAPNGSADTTL